MKYQPSFNIWTIPHPLLRYVQPGQHVYAGDTSTRGVFLGVKRSGTVVVAWEGNAKGRRREYISTLRQYALGDRHA